MADVTLRDLRADDVSACAALVGKTPLFAPYGYGEAEAVGDLQAELDRARPASTMLVAQAHGRVVGFCRFLVQGAFDRCGYLRLIVVDPSYTSGGVGRLMMAELEKRHLAPAGIMLLCADDNPGAQRFYAGLGYRQVGLVEDYVRPGLHEQIFFKPPPRD